MNLKEKKCRNARQRELRRKFVSNPYNLPYVACYYHYGNLTKREYHKCINASKELYKQRLKKYTNL